jgi:hypothetical protein
MMIIQRGDGWQATVTPKGAWWRRQFTSEHDAQGWECEASAVALGGETPSLGQQAKAEAGKPRNLSELCAYVRDRHWHGQKSQAKTLADARAMAVLIGMHTPVKSVDADAIDKAIIKLREQGNSNATINRKLSALGKMLSVAVSIGVIDRV